MTTVHLSGALPATSVASVHRSESLAKIAGVRHGITGRASHLGRAAGNVGYSPPRDKDDAWAMRRVWGDAVGVDAERIVTLGQVHGAAVVRVGHSDAGRGARPGSVQVGLGDALISDEPRVVLMTLHADCLPILLVDPARPAIAAVHAGWRGTVADVAGATVAAMTAAYGSNAASLVAYLGPAIGGCCYDVGADVAGGWATLAGMSNGAEPLRRWQDRWRFDLAAANRALLVRAGLDPRRVEHSGVCTRCGGDRWFSHRGQGPATGRFGSLIALDDL